MRLATVIGFALLVAAASCSESDTGPRAVTGTEQAAACTCPDDTTVGTCGSWTCTVSRAGNLCVWKADENEGDACYIGTKSVVGRCVEADGRTAGAHLVCCTGCATGAEGDSSVACREGLDNGFCGYHGNKCLGCDECESCEEGKCQPSTGNSCGTCKACSSGVCKDQSVGTGCGSGSSTGRCAKGAICCSGCIDANDQCLSSTDQACGLSGAACQDCGQCGTCSGGGCSPKTSGACSDGDPCTEGDTCSGSSGCVGTPVNVDDGNECTDDACTAVDGITHTSKAENTTCTGTGNACASGGWHCIDQDSDSSTPRICQPVAGLTCYDGDPCTDDTPDCTNGVCPYGPVADDTACTNGLRCVLNESCQGGTCTGEPRNCSDDNPCTTDSCVETDGPDIDPVTGCKHAPKSMSTTCDDGNGCTKQDHCDADGACAGSQVTCSALDECHGPGSCDPGTGECSDPRLQDGTACQTTGTCASGQCKGGTTTPGEGGAAGAGGSSGTSTTGGSAGASGNPGGGQGNESGTGTSEAGAGGSSTSGTSGKGGSATGGTTGTGGSGATAGDTAEAGGPSGPLYHRDPGGCACSVERNHATPVGYLAFGLMGALGLVSRRRRRAA